MTRMKVLLALVAAALLLAPGAFGAVSSSKVDQKVQLLAINDFHGNLEPNTPGAITYCCELDQNPAVNKMVAVRRNAGGVEYLATLVKSLRDRNSNTLTVGAGDMIGASPLLSGLFHDEPAIEALNSLGLQVTGVGNHEFDEGLRELYRMQFGGCLAPGNNSCLLGRFGGSLFQYLAANVFVQGSNASILPPFEVRRVGNSGTKIAFIGLTLEGTPLVVTPTAIQGLEFRPEVPVVNGLVKRLRDAFGIHTFVILLHQGGIQTAPFAIAGRFPAFATGFADINGCENLQGDIAPIVQGLDRDVDVVVSAHTHQPYVCPNYAGTGILLTSASSFGRLVTSIDLSIDPRTDDVTSKSATNYVAKQTSGPFNTALKDPNNPSAGQIDPLGAPVAKDPVESKILSKWQAIATPIANRVVGHITQDFTSARDPGGATAAGEGTLGDAIADAQLEATKPTDFGGSQIAFMNPGGIRNPLRFLPQTGETRAAGEVTYGNAFAVQPFSNTLQVKTMTGAQIYRLLEQQWSGPNAGTNKKILTVSNGFSYQYDPNRAGDQKVKPGSVMLGGNPVDPLASYRVTMNNFLADGGDGFSVFREGTNPLGGEVDLDAFVQYLQAHDPLPVPTLDRITLG